MSGQHTAGPWEVVDSMTVRGPFRMGDDSAPGIQICSLPGFMSHDERMANARRIVACVNACEGISAEVLQAMPFSAAVAEESRRYREAVAQRDELLAALEDIELDARVMRPYVGQVSRLCDIARAAIAKVQP